MHSTPVIVGLDIHKKSTYATIIDREGNLIKKGKIKNDIINRIYSYSNQI